LPFLWIDLGATHRYTVCSREHMSVVAPSPDGHIAADHTTAAVTRSSLSHNDRFRLDFHQHLRID
jgi:hypothetical protein